MTLFQQVRQLLDLITNAVNTIEEACKETGTDLPNLDQPFHPASEAFRANPAAAQAASVISAAASHLDALVAPPRNTLHHLIGGHWKSAALRQCLEGHVTEILREAGPNGLHVSDIAAKNGLDAAKLARCLRILAIDHVYREVKPDVFANNRISTLYDTLKSSDEIIKDPEHKYDGTIGVGAVMGHVLDEHFKSAAYFWEASIGPRASDPGAPTDTPFAKSISDGKTFWEWIEQPEHDFVRRRFDIGMHGVQTMTPGQTIVSAFDWQSLPPNALVVDVGGGVGSVSLPLAKDFPDLNIVIQDRASVVEIGKEASIAIWRKELPDALASGRVQFQAQDFFSSQPQTNATVFMLKNILHDWSDQYCSKILKQLRGAATPNTKLVILEVVLPYTCHDPRDDNPGSVIGGVPVKAPAPLLANWGTVNEIAYILDMAMMTLFNGQERTIQQFDQLFTGAGWKITSIHRQHGVDITFVSSLQAIPI
ncbi:hypothetical protein APHAL10511_004670 [Amanita phalloides]|nr:hypothetical protein APHAL10511_004670 [Amanita phalloides]